MHIVLVIAITSEGIRLSIRTIHSDLLRYWPEELKNKEPGMGVFEIGLLTDEDPLEKQGTGRKP